MKTLKEQIESAKEELLNGHVISFPTETVMGLAIVYNNYDAYLRLNEIKNRREDKPYTMMVKDVSEIEKYAFINKKIKKVIDAFMPGSITILLKAKDNVPGYVTHDTGIIGIRIPTNIEAIELLKAMDVPLLVPSANKAGEKPALNDKEVKEIFKSEIHCVIEGTSLGQLASTIVDLSNDEIKLIRMGPIDYQEIERRYNIDE